MKKTVKQADGSEVTIEGTPEEIAEFERQQKRQGGVSETPKKSTKKILLDQKTFDDIFKQFDKIFEEMNKLQPQGIWPVHVHTHCVGCATCQPWKFVPQYPEVTWQYHTTVTTNKIDLD